MGRLKLIRHFLTPDHLAFFAILPSVFINPFLAAGCWSFALIWDIGEEYSGTLKRIEKWCKGRD